MLKRQVQHAEILTEHALLVCDMTCPRRVSMADLARGSLPTDHPNASPGVGRKGAVDWSYVGGP